jgi:NADH:ubiquinone oxidoreductase subunit 3 (subunit A)
MLYNYVAVLFFAIVAIFVPYSMLIGAKMLRHNIPANPVKNAPYESAELPIGENRDVINEYLPYFIIFIPFEVVAMILILWSAVSKQISFYNNILIISMVILSMLFSLAGYKIIRGEND